MRQGNRKLAQSANRDRARRGLVARFDVRIFANKWGAILVQQFCALIQKPLIFKGFCVFWGEKQLSCIIALFVNRIDLNLQPYFLLNHVEKV